MTLKVPIKDVVSPNGLHLAFPVSTLPPPSTGGVQPATATGLIIYTGWIGFNHGAGSDLTRTTVQSFIPNDDRSVDIFTVADTQILPHAVSASLTAFGADPDVAAVDSAHIDMAHREFKGIEGVQNLLVLTASVAAQNGAALKLSYQIVVAPLTSFDSVLFNPLTQVQLGGGDTTP
ncbi:hypothetical protein ACFY3M_48060 [Streptomyces mirabilis]|uniref:hypothetical protein n=1 Tax=Streptomyces mirabilis TaxID=68239 RepID=UPI00369E925F